MLDTMKARFHKLSILDRHDSEQISRVKYLRIAWKHTTAARARVEADSATGSVSNVNGCVAIAQPKSGPHRQSVVSYSAFFTVTPTLTFFCYNVIYKHCMIQAIMYMGNQCQQNAVACRGLQ